MCMYVCMYVWYSIWLIGRGCADCLMIEGMYVCMYVFLKDKFEVPYVTFCRGIAVERLLRVGYLGCLGKGRFFRLGRCIKGFFFC